MSQFHELWITEAVDDMRAAAALYENGFWSKACLYSQQAVEKAAKAILVFSGARLEHTHNVMSLFEQVEKGAGLRFSDEEREMAAAMTLTFTNAQYPNLTSDAPPSRLFTQANAVRHIQWALRFLDITCSASERLVGAQSRAEILSVQEHMSALASKPSHDAAGTTARP